MIINVKIPNNEDPPLQTVVTKYDLLRIFGIRTSELSKSQLYLITYLYMKTLSVFNPFEMVDKDLDDDESSSEEEKVILIKQGEVETIYGARRMILIGKNKLVPVTITVLCSGESFLGIRVVIYNPSQAQETGFFLAV